ncbi:MAG: hypothetical protein KIG28_04960, partial [Bacteroidales bacterium]|nr:hypothetical protein [Bacteroidales bacterium]
AHYFEDAREEFGRKYGLEYMRMAKNSFAAPLVELTFKAIRPMYYERPYSVAIRYIPTEAAKILFRYEITDLQSGEVVVPARLCRSLWIWSIGFSGTSRTTILPGRRDGR